MKEEYERDWLEEEIKKRINIKCITANLLFGDDSLLEPEEFLITEEKAERNIKKILEDLNCDDEEYINVFHEYGRIIRDTHFKLGVRMGICLETELLKETEI